MDYRWGLPFIVKEPAANPGDEQSPGVFYWPTYKLQRFNKALPVVQLDVVDPHTPSTLKARDV